MTYSNILPFLSDLAENNNREWFADNKARYDEARAEMLDLTAVLIKRIGEFDPEIKYLEPKDCLFRIYRDIRFSPNKMPYKLHMGSYIAAGGGHKSLRSGYYIHLQPGNCMVSGGIWCPDSKSLKHFRSVIDTEYDELQRIVDADAHRRFFGNTLTCFNRLQRPPQGYRADHPAIEWLKMKEWLVEHRFADSLTASPTLVDHLTGAARAMMPFSKWCNTAMFE